MQTNMERTTSSYLQQRQWGINNNDINSSSLPSFKKEAARNPNPQSQQQQQQPQQQPQLLPNSNFHYQPPPPPPGRIWWACLFLSSLISWGSAMEVIRFQHEQQLHREYYNASPLFSGNKITNNDNYDAAASSSSLTTLTLSYSSSYGNTDEYYDRETSAKIATVAIYSITTIFLLTFVYLAITLLLPQNLSRSFTTRSNAEFTVLLILFGLSCTAVSTTTNPIYGLAISPMSGEVGFGNLYYSTWACWICVLALVLSYIRTEYGIDVLMEIKLRGGKRLRQWIYLIVVNLLVMASSATCYDAKCGNYHEDEEEKNGAEVVENNKIYYDNGQNNKIGLDPWEVSRSKKYCRRAAFGVSVGCIGCVTSLSIVAMRLACVTKTATATVPTTSSSSSSSSSSSPQEDFGGGNSKSKKISFVVECLSSWILLFLNCFSVAYLTSEGGPGVSLGNLFYATWITLVLVIFVAISCFGEVQMAKKIYQRRYNQLGGSAESTMSEEGMGLEGVSGLNSSSTYNYERQSTGGTSLRRFDDFDSEDAPSMIIRSICSGSVVEVLVGD